LAWQAGLPNVEAMRNGMTVEQADLWSEAYATGQLDDGWQQSAMIACEIRNLPVRLCCWFFGHKMKSEELATPDSFIPRPTTKNKSKKSKKNNTRDFANRLAKQFGK